eukprot:390843_1
MFTNDNLKQHRTKRRRMSRGEQALYNSQTSHKKRRRRSSISSSFSQFDFTAHNISNDPQKIEKLQRRQRELNQFIAKYGSSHRGPVGSTSGGPESSSTHRRRPVGSTSGGPESSSTHRRRPVGSTSG